jgi:hypothetical protein
MIAPKQYTIDFYQGKNALAFKIKMDKYRKQQNLSDSYAPHVQIIRVPPIGKLRHREFKYTITYYKYDPLEVKKNTPIHTMNVQARSKLRARYIFYERTKNNPEVAYIRVNLLHQIENSNERMYSVEYRKSFTNRRRGLTRSK